MIDIIIALVISGLWAVASGLALCHFWRAIGGESSVRAALVLLAGFTLLMAGAWTLVMATAVVGRTYP